jgi:ribosomal protein S18 acetylase RimI-like enzyme
MIEIRTATLKDIPLIVRLIQELAATSGEESPINNAYVEEYLAAPGSFVLLASDRGVISGLLSYSVRPDLYHAGLCCMVEELVVTQDKRSQGIGGALLQALLSQAQAEGWAEVSVGVMSDNHRALAFYRRHGLVDDALLLEKHMELEP